MSESTEYVYSVKFLCGTVPLKPFFGPDPLPPGKEPPAKPANYTTTINVHNPHEHQRGYERGVPYRKKAVLSSYVDIEGNRPKPQEHFNPGEERKEVLGPDMAFAIDPRDIVDLLGKTLPNNALFIEGFIVIHAPIELDVVAVYTSQPSMVGRVVRQATSVSIDIEYVEAKVVARG